MSFRLGIDTGGTFTDFVLVGPTGDIQLYKTPSTPQDPTQALRAGMSLITSDLDVGVMDFLGECDLIIHGSTVALNALLQLRGAKVGLFCTEGHEDSLEIRLGHKEDGHRYDFLYPAATMLVPRRLRIPVSERVMSDGTVVTPIDEQDVYAGIETFRRYGVDAVGVSFLWSFVNQTHERRVGEILAAELPHVYVTLSVDLLPQIREYTRASTVAVNSYVGPTVSAHIESVELMLRQLGYRGPIRYSQSNGGVASGRVLGPKAVYALNSGPAAGPSASIFFGTAIGRQELLTVDMGGTSTDISLVHGGRTDLVKDIDVGRYRIGTPVVNVVSIGAGGGSIGWLDHHGILQVGPQSAEAVPGPACYQRGGTEATVTDSLVVLGYLNQHALLGGRLEIDCNAAARVVGDQIARPLGLSLDRAALAIFNVTNANMVGGIRAVSVERGYDPRDFVLVAGGGATAAHAGRLAQELGIRHVLIPTVASGLCAFGEAIADVKHTYLASYTCPFPALDPARLDELFQQMEREGRQDLQEEGFSPNEIAVERSVDMKYLDQVHECAVSLPIFEITDERLADIAEAFHRRHEALYTYCERDNTPELINVEVTVYGRSPLEATSSDGVDSNGSRPAPREARQAYFEEYGDYREVPVFDRESLQLGGLVDGPAIIDEPTTTIVVFPACSVKLERSDLYRMIVGAP